MNGISKSQWKQTIVTLASTFGFALLVNWGVLTFFGQKSADRAEHSLVGILLLMGYVAIRAERHTNAGRAVGVFFVALIPCYLGTVFPDVDIRLLGIGGHRNPLFHSSLSFLLLVWVVGRQPGVLHTVVAGYGVGLASHLWWDVFDYGDVRWLPGGAIDRLWLGVHGFLCLIPPGSRWFSGKEGIGMKKSTRLLLLVIAAFLGIVVLRSLPLFDAVQASPGRFDHVKLIGMIMSGAVFLDSNIGKICLYDLDDGKPRYLGQLIEMGQRLGGHGEK